MDARQDLENALRMGPRHPGVMFLALVGCDLAVIATTWVLCVLVRYGLGGEFELATYWSLWPLLLLYLAIYAALGGYRILLPPPREIKVCSLGTFLVALIFTAVTFWLRTPLTYSRAILVATTCLLLLGVPAARTALRSLTRRSPWWGMKSVFYGFDGLPQNKLESTLAHLNANIRPVAFLSHKARPKSRELLGLPVFEGAKALEQMPTRRINAIFVLRIDAEVLQDMAEVVEKAATRFAKIILLHDALNLGNHWGQSVEVGNLPGLKIVQRLTDPKRMFIKRMTDVLLTLLLFIPTLPLLAVLAACIKIDSKGPVFFSHQRLGRRGRTFTMLKLRTMVANADEVFKQEVLNNEQLQADWEANYKLQADPRVTRIGRFLRRASLDELPQLFNVLCGDMSLIGPRPIIPAEVEKYGSIYEMYMRVRPGMTGLWQVSGRSSLGYADRVELDAYYIKNWSFWLDMYILIKTPAAMCNTRTAF